MEFLEGCGRLCLWNGKSANFLGGAMAVSGLGFGFRNLCSVGNLLEKNIRGKITVSKRRRRIAPMQHTQILKFYIC